jgi:transposase
MTKVKEFAGIDISKLTFDVAIPTGKEGHYQHKKFSNNVEGYRSFQNSIHPDCICTMEATGSYYLPLATYLHKHGIEVKVVNPLAVKHFSRMQMTRAKTDKKDARLIAEYTKSQYDTLHIWKPKPDYMIELQQLQAMLDGFIKRRTQLMNQQEAFTASGSKRNKASQILQQEIDHVEKQISKIEKEMVRITEEYHAGMFERLQSIPGIGKRTAMMFIVITDGFTKFETAKQLVGYIGLSPRIYDSGTTVKGKARICKMGMSSMRALLYMCGMQAKQRNTACKQMYERLEARGKNGKLIIIAVANKLVRQAFGVAMSERNYQENLIV